MAPSYPPSRQARRPTHLLSDDDPYESVVQTDPFPAVEETDPDPYGTVDQQQQQQQLQTPWLAPSPAPLVLQRTGNRPFRQPRLITPQTLRATASVQDTALTTTSTAANLVPDTALSTETAAAAAAAPPPPPAAAAPSSWLLAEERYERQLAAGEFTNLFRLAAAGPSTRKRAASPKPAPPTKRAKPAPRRSTRLPAVEPTPGNKGKGRAVEVSDDEDDEEDDEESDAYCPGHGGDSHDGQDHHEGDEGNASDSDLSSLDGLLDDDDIMPADQDDGLEGDADAAEFMEPGDQSEDDEPVARRGRTDTFEAMNRSLNMTPATPYSSGATAAEDTARGQQRLRQLLVTARTEASSQEGRMAAWSFASTVNWVIQRATTDYLLQQMLAGMSEEVVQVLGRQRVDAAGLLSLPCRVQSREQLDQSWAVYVAVVRRQGQQDGIYVGSATARLRAWDRLNSYHRIRIGARGAVYDSPWTAALSDPAAEISFRLLWQRPIAGAPHLALIFEGLLATLLGSVANQRPDGSVPARLVNPAIVEFTRENRLPLAQLQRFTRLNVVSPLRQGATRYRMYTRDCTACNQPIERGSKCSSDYSEAGLMRMHADCGRKVRRAQQKRDFPGACAPCNTRGLASTCTGTRAPCNNCRSTKYAAHCSRGLRNGAQDPGEKCDRCFRENRRCDGKAPCGVCVTVGARCSNAGQEKLEKQDSDEKCDTCRKMESKCDGNAPCGYCVKYKYRCSNAGQAPRKRKGQDAAEKCDMCRKTRAKCDGQRPKCGACVKRKRRCTWPDKDKDKDKDEDRDADAHGTDDQHDGT